MNCTYCGRTLREDSRFCDFCGKEVPVIDVTPVSQQTTLDTKLLFKWILISIVITAVFIILFRYLGFNVFFGGFFLPFFFKRKKVN
jgi:uncharacterized membrane protein YvbJ